MLNIQGAIFIWRTIFGTVFHSNYPLFISSSLLGKEGFFMQSFHWPLAGVVLCTGTVTVGQSNQLFRYLLAQSMRPLMAELEVSLDFVLISVEK